MIKINLLPVRDIVRRKKFINQIIAILVTVGSITGALALIEAYQLSSIGEMKEKIANLESEKTKFKKTLDEIKKIEEEKKLLTTRIDIINQLKQSSSLTVHVLDEIANLTPSNRMWLKRLSQSGGQLELKGMALDDQTIARYMDDLDASGYVQNVRLATSSLEMYAERNLKAFSITANVDMPKK